MNRNAHPPDLLLEIAELRTALEQAKKEIASWRILADSANEARDQAEACVRILANALGSSEYRQAAIEFFGVKVGS